MVFTFQKYTPNCIKKHYLKFTRSYFKINHMYTDFITLSSVPTSELVTKLKDHRNR